jgi:hypothetical protein
VAIEIDPIGTAPIVADDTSDDFNSADNYDKYETIHPHNGFDLEFRLYADGSRDVGDLTGRSHSEFSWNSADESESSLGNILEKYYGKNSRALVNKEWGFNSIVECDSSLIGVGGGD